MDKDKCTHPEFAVHANVMRLSDGDDGPISGYSADIKVSCVVCEMPFKWMGLPGGLSPSRPMVSADQLELRAPIRPMDDPR